MENNQIKSLKAQLEVIEKKMTDATDADAFVRWQTEAENVREKINKSVDNKPAIRPATVTNAELMKQRVENSFKLDKENPDPNLDCCKIFNQAVDMTTADADVDAKVFSRPTVDWIDNAITLMPTIPTFSLNALQINLRQEDLTQKQTHILNVSEKGSLGQSSYGVKETTENMKYLGSTYRTTLQLQTDAQKDYFRNYIRARFDYDIRSYIENQVFFGRGKATAHAGEMKGFFTKASGAKIDEASDLAYTKPANATNSQIVNAILDRIPAAAADIASTSKAGVNPDTIAMNRKTWARFQVARDGDNRFLLDRFLPAPRAEGTMNLWGMRLVLSERIADNDYFIYASRMLEFHAFNGGTIKYDTGMTGDDFTTLQTHVRGYMWGFAHEFRANAVKRGILDAV